jgi:hypothetical protein
LPANPAMLRLQLLKPHGLLSPKVNLNYGYTILKNALARLIHQH